MTRNLALFFIFFFFPALAVAAAPDEGVSSLQPLVEEALENNPDLHAARARWQMFTHKVVPAQTLSDPRLSLAFINYPSSP